MGFPALHTTYFQPTLRIAGVTRDSTGAIVPNAVVNLFLTVGNVFVSTQNSDANGNFIFYLSSAIPQYFLVAYLAGSPDTEGTTVNTLTAA